MSDSSHIDPQDAEPYEPTDEEVALLIASSPKEREATQALVLRECSDRWQKVAKIVSNLLDEFERNYPHLPFAFLQATMETLEDLGRLEIAGDVWAMRYSEIRLVQPKSGAE